MKTEEKKVYIECLRVFAAFFVLYNHNYAFNYYKQIEGTALYWFSLFMSCFCKFSVSLFFMIAGAVLLGKTERFSIYLKKRVVKTVLMIVVFSLLQDVWEYRMTHQFDIFEFVKSLYKEPAANGYWFLYLYLSFMITLPFFRHVAVNMTKNEFFFLVVVALLYGALPVLNLFFASSCYLTLDILDVNYFYPLIGFYISKKIDCDKLDKKIQILLAGVAFLSVCLSMFLVTLQKCMTGEYSETYLSLCIPYVCIWLFVLFKANDKRAYRYRKVLVYAGRGTIGVYLLGNVIYDVLYPIFLFMSNYMIRGVANCIFLVLQLVVGIITTNLFFSLVNDIKKVIRRENFAIGES